MFKMEKDSLGNAVRAVGDWLPEIVSLIIVCERKKHPTHLSRNIDRTTKPPHYRGVSRGEDE